MKILNYISRLLVGLVFLFSSTVKAIDPSGFVYKLEDYFSAFNISFLDNFSLVLAVILFTVEFLGGLSVMFNIRFRTGIWLVMLLMVFFTPLTLFIALTNPVSDCGCFGDAVKLTNWQTFIKNIILLVPVIWLFAHRKSIGGKIGIARGWALLAISSLIFIAFIFYNLRYLPAIDFLPYKAGTYIPDKMVVPEDKPGDVYRTTFIYEKNGEKKEFDLTNYPAGDTAWKFIDQKSVLVSKGYQPPIHDFVLSTPEGDDLTAQILSSDNYTMLMVARKIEGTDRELLNKGYETGKFCIARSIDFYVLTASTSSVVRENRNELNFCLVDETTLKTMVRSDPGYLLLKKGTILHKWSWANLPDENEILKITADNNSN